MPHSRSKLKSWASSTVKLCSNSLSFAIAARIWLRLRALKHRAYKWSVRIWACLHVPLRSKQCGEVSSQWSKTNCIKTWSTNRVVCHTTTWASKVSGRVRRCNEVSRFYRSWWSLILLMLPRALKARFCRLKSTLIRLMLRTCHHCTMFATLVASMTWCSTLAITTLCLRAPLCYKYVLITSTQCCQLFITSQSSKKVAKHASRSVVSSASILKLFCTLSTLTH